MKFQHKSEDDVDVSSLLIWSVYTDNDGMMLRCNNRVVLSVNKTGQIAINYDNTKKLNLIFI